ncbi:MAG: TIGR01621 family pseudouridine synthase, partial [Deltaproteobacteria bacterium]|nr:TIGR01621 family pseudouridine synthase [Deltaproteobacteria bacterium]
TREFVLIDKQPAVGFHKGSAAEGLAASVRRELDLKELYAVHRLDTVTSGLLLFAKTRSVARELSVQFSAHRIEKYYLAISDRRPRKRQGMLIGDMERGRRGAWKLARTTHNPSITQFFSCGCAEGLRLFLVRLHTGKTHQARVVLKSLGAPILGDPLYYKESTGRENVERCYLHAYALRFVLGGRGHVYTCTPSVGAHFSDAGFVQALEKYERPWELLWPKVKGS